MLDRKPRKKDFQFYSGNFNKLILLDFFNPKSAIKNPKSCLNGLFVQALNRPYCMTTDKDPFNNCGFFYLVNKRYPRTIIFAKILTPMTIYMPLPVMGVLSCKTVIDLMSKYNTLRTFFSMRTVCPVLPTSFKGSEGLGLYTPHLFQWDLRDQSSVRFHKKNQIIN